MSSKTIFSIQGKGLKLDTRADVETHLKELYAMPDVEEVHMGGNTLGVEACQTIAEILKKATKLKVSPQYPIPPLLPSAPHHFVRRESADADVMIGGRLRRYIHRPSHL